MLFNTFDFLLSAVLYALLFILHSGAPFYLHILLIILCNSNRFSLNWILTTLIWWLIANCIHVQIHVGTGECVVFMCAYTGMFIVLNVYFWVCLYLYAYVCASICMCLYISRNIYITVVCEIVRLYPTVCMFMCVCK